MALFADFLLGVATARHHCTESQAAGAEGAAAALTAQLWTHFNINCTVNLPSTFNMYSYVSDISQKGLTSFLKRLNFDAQE